MCRLDSCYLTLGYTPRQEGTKGSRLEGAERKRCTDQFQAAVALLGGTRAELGAEMWIRESVGGLDVDKAGAAAIPFGTSRRATLKFEVLFG